MMDFSKIGGLLVRSKQNQTLTPGVQQNQGGLARSQPSPYSQQLGAVGGSKPGAYTPTVAKMQGNQLGMEGSVKNWGGGGAPDQMQSFADGSAGGGVNPNEGMATTGVMGKGAGMQGSAAQGGLMRYNPETGESTRADQSNFLTSDANTLDGGQPQQAPVEEPKEMSEKDMEKYASMFGGMSDGFG
jgi:hypothetical protein